MTMTIGKKIGLLLAMVLLVTAILAIVGAMQVTGIERTVEDLRLEDVKP